MAAMKWYHEEYPSEPMLDVYRARLLPHADEVKEITEEFKSRVCNETSDSKNRYSKAQLKDLFKRLGIEYPAHVNMNWACGFLKMLLLNEAVQREHLLTARDRNRLRRLQQAHPHTVLAPDRSAVILREYLDEKHEQGIPVTQEESNAESILHTMRSLYYETHISDAKLRAVCKEFDLPTCGDAAQVALALALYFHAAAV